MQENFVTSRKFSDILCIYNKGRVGWGWLHPSSLDFGCHLPSKYSLQFFSAKRKACVVKREIF